MGLTEARRKVCARPHRKPKALVIEVFDLDEIESLELTPRMAAELAEEIVKTIPRFSDVVLAR
jgi:hypothetical protein